jgi:hypothetical protein
VIKLNKPEKPEQSADNGANTLSRGEVLCMLSDSLRKVHAKLNTGRITKKDHVKLDFIKAQVSLSESYLSTLENFEAEEAAIREQRRTEQLMQVIEMLRQQGAIEFFQKLHSDPVLFDACGVSEEEGYTYSKLEELGKKEGYTGLTITQLAEKAKSENLFGDIDDEVLDRILHLQNIEPYIEQGLTDT